MAAQLNSVRLKLEQRRKRIEDEKRKMENVMVKQREKVGQEAFLRAVVKGTVIRLTTLVLVVDPETGIVEWWHNWLYTLQKKEV